MSSVLIHTATLLYFHRGSGAGLSRFTLFVVVIVIGVVVVFVVVVENEGSNLRGGLNLSSCQAARAFCTYVPQTWVCRVPHNLQNVCRRLGGSVFY